MQTKLPYQKPTLVRRSKLSQITAQVVVVSGVVPPPPVALN